MDYISTRQAAEKWGVKMRRVQQLCEAGQIEGAVRFVRDWMIPKDAVNPTSRKSKKTNPNKAVNADER